MFNKSNLYSFSQASKTLVESLDPMLQAPTPRLCARKPWQWFHQTTKDWFPQRINTPTLPTIEP